VGKPIRLGTGMPSGQARRLNRAGPTGASSEREEKNMKGYGGTWSVRSGPDPTALGRLPHLDTDGRDRGVRERAELGGSLERVGEQWGGLQVAVGSPLVHLQQATVREAVWFAGERWWPRQ
jgi:hypothetical protein